MYLCENEDACFEDLLNDDHTSSTSSLATSISVSEDCDELHLGAEANWFSATLRKNSGNFSDTANNSQKCACSYCSPLIIMKERYSLIESDLPSKTYFSSLSSFDDILKAREGDASEILASLGFVNDFQDKYKREVLTRFNPSPLLTDQDNKFLEDITHIKELDNVPHQIDDLENIRSNPQEQRYLLRQEFNEKNKVLSNYGDHTKKPLHSKATKPRNKGWNSRQSSFDVLPLVKEESIHDDDVNVPSPLKILAIDTDDHVHLSVTDKPKKNSDKNQVSLPEIIKYKTIGLKYSSSRMESFELEEINSACGELSDVRRFSGNSDVKLTETSFLGEYVCSKITENSTGDETDTSSGFDEDDILNGTSLQSIRSDFNTAAAGLCDNNKSAQIDQLDTTENTASEPYIQERNLLDCSKTESDCALNHLNNENKILKSGANAAQNQLT